MVILNIMSSITLYHNGRCGKSRKALEILEHSKLKFRVVNYLQEPPAEETLRELASLIKGGVKCMVRTKEDQYKELFGSRIPSDEELIRAISDHPILLERPIVAAHGKAMIVRTDEATEELKHLLELNF